MLWPSPWVRCWSDLAASAPAFPFATIRFILRCLAQPDPGRGRRSAHPCITVSAMAGDLAQSSPSKVEKSHCCQHMSTRKA
ncbi:hypothetical protein BCR37DRAFT_378186 [Protomyces lactucae-debilis]|uniref:Uncharacterized protein n=1 Tax=Protomyces lactucae-debilis TaxID=2754530 RepID=A0A1Y2FMC2_PROLT|nr:uncharacterized protein BCR37DRAFT_378186 [Protomyces lactucae-debilis]ORY85123.1 hypothetical protein BCR37DRAFT_378186 [Protomyces lactucae-debilis]